MGQCIVVILFALFASALKNAQKFARFSSLLMKISGFILIGAGLYIYYRIFSNL
jgi:threonine/homoserine/homoserine lactone efflux protein